MVGMFKNATQPFGDLIDCHGGQRILEAQIGPKAAILGIKSKIHTVGIHLKVSPPYL